MNSVILVSLCEKKFIDKKPSRTSEIVYRFHFCGAYIGKEIRQVLVYDENPERFTVGEEYLLHLQVLECACGKLKGRVLKHKSFKDIRWS